MSTTLDTAPEALARAAAPQQRLRAMRQVYLRTVDSWIPEAMVSGGGEELRCARLVVSFTLLLLVLGLEGFWFFHWALPAGAALGIDLALVLGLSMCLAIPHALRRFGSVEIAANLVVAASFLVLLAIFVVLGGIEAPVLHWCALIPMLAVLMGARRSAWVWASVAVLTLAMFALLPVLGISLPHYLEESGLAGDRRWVQRVVDIGSWIAILFLVALLYERHKAQQTEELGSTNAELTREITQRRKAEQRTRYLAYYDELTSLPNRQFFKEQLELAMRESERDDRMVAVMFLDLDGFKEINDSYGHRLGDHLLQQVANRLQTCVRNADAVFRGTSDEDEELEDAVVSRLGGDEFTVLLVCSRRRHLILTGMFRAFL